MMTTRPQDRRRLILLLPAVGAALARGGDGGMLIPAWAACVLQAPALLYGLRGLWREKGGFDGGSAVGLDRILLLLTMVGGGVAAIAHRDVAAIFLSTTIFLAGRAALVALSTAASRMECELDRPQRLIRWLAPVWIGCALALTVILSLPISTQSSVPDYRHNFWLHVSNCGFSAASCLTLTGSGVYSFAEDFTLVGQSALMLATQVWGMALAVVGLAIVRPALRRPIRLKTLWTTLLLLQLAGIGVMCSAWSGSDTDSVIARIGWSLVHASSALFNSGYLLRADGVSPYLADARIFSTITLLCIVGSFGIPLLADLLLPAKPNEKDKAPPHGGNPLHKLASWEAGMAFVLIAGAASLLFLCETPRLLPDRLIPTRPFDMGTRLVPLRDEGDHSMRWRTAVFVSATLRSAGIQSVPVSQGALSWPSVGVVVLCIMLGGTVGGVGGGMRTSAIVLAGIGALHGPGSWRREVRPAGAGWRLVRRVCVFGATWFAVNVLGALLVHATTGGDWYEQGIETIAALGNVGITTGLSLHLTGAGRLVMIGLMVFGRWAPILFWIRLSSNWISDSTAKQSAAI